MKKLFIFTFIFVVAIALLSCYWGPDTGVGSVRLSLPDVSSKGVGDRYARVWLLADNMIYPLGDDRDYLQELISGGEDVTITLADIPVGPVYRVWVAIVDQFVGSFNTHAWAESGAFQMFPGDEVAVVFSTTTLSDSKDKIFSPFVDNDLDTQDGDPTMMDKDLLDVEVFSNNIYATDANNLYGINFDFANTSLDYFTEQSPAGKIRSASAAFDPFVSDALVVNTERGIYSLSEGFDSPAITLKLGSIDVLESGADDYASRKVLFFRRAEGWGGTYADSDVPDPTKWTWANRDAGRVTDLLVEANSFPEGYAYFATSEGAFRLWGEYFVKLDSGETPNLSDYKAGFQAPAPILSLGMVRPEVEIMLIGTEDGVWSANLIGGPNVIDSSTLYYEEKTKGHRIHQIATYYNSTYAAYLSDTHLFVWDDSVGEMKVFPFCAGLPGRITGLAWIELFAAGPPIYYLIVSGDEGLVYKEFSSILPS